MIATHLYLENPAANRIFKVRFMRYFDKARRYSRIEFENGRKTSVPTQDLKKIVNH